MDLKYIISILLAVAIILAVIFKDKIKASFLGMKLNAENSTRRNRAKITGNKNDVSQGSNTKKTPAKNVAKINGDGNYVKQS